MFAVKRSYVFQQTGPGLFIWPYNRSFRAYLVAQVGPCMIGCLPANSSRGASLSSTCTLTPRLASCCLARNRCLAEAYKAQGARLSCLLCRGTEAGKQHCTRFVSGMASPVACVGVADAAGAPPQAAPSNLPGLQLLLRILPFRSSKHQHPIKVCVRGVQLQSSHAAAPACCTCMHACPGAAHSFCHVLHSYLSTQRDRFTASSWYLFAAGAQICQQ